MIDRLRTVLFSPQMSLDFVYLHSLGIALIIIKLVLLIVDPLVIVFDGDSRNYMETAFEHWIPTDRSFTYGILIRLITSTSHSLTGIMLLQVMASVVTALAATSLGMLAFGLNRRWGTLLAMAYSIAPFALLYEREIMTENLGLAFLVLAIVCGCIYLKRPRLWLLPIMVLLGIIAGSLRLSYIPITGLLALGVPLVAHVHRDFSNNQRRHSEWRALLLALMLSLFTYQGLVYAYQQMYAIGSGRPPAIQHEDGFFMLAAWAPLVRAEHFPSASLADRVLTQVRLPVADRSTREFQRWDNGGLVQALKREINDIPMANTIAKAIAMQAAMDQPLGLLRIVWDGYRDYLTPAIVRSALNADRYTPPDSRMQMIMLDHYALDAARLVAFQTPIGRWFGAAAPWVWILLFSPLIGAVLVLVGDENQRLRSLTVLLLWILVGIACGLSTSPVTRYLHPVEWFGCVVLVSSIRLLSIRLLTRRSNSN